MRKMNLKKAMMAAVVAAMALVTVIGSTITASASPRTAKKIIGIEQAKEAALKAMKIKEADAVFTEQECELDDGVYELEFTAGKFEYDVEVNAYTGKVIKADYETTVTGIICGMTVGMTTAITAGMMTTAGMTTDSTMMTTGTTNPFSVRQ